MPLIINQMPSGAIQFPMNGPSPAQMHAMQAAAFMGRPSTRPQEELATMLALIQFLGQRDELGLRREELGLNREQMANLLRESSANRDLTREGMADSREESRRQHEAVMEQLGITRETAKSQSEYQQAMARALTDQTGASVEAQKLQTEVLRSMMAEGERDKQLARAGGQLSAYQGQAGQLQSLEEEQFINSGLMGYNAGVAKAVAAMPPAVNRVRTKLQAGGELSATDVERFSTGIAKYTDQVVDLLSKARNDHERAAIISTFEGELATLNLTNDPDLMDKAFASGRLALADQVSEAIGAARSKLAPFAGLNVAPNAAGYEAYLRNQALAARKQQMGEMAQLTGQVQQGINQAYSSSQPAAAINDVILKSLQERTPQAIAPSLPDSGTDALLAELTRQQAAQQQSAASRPAPVIVQPAGPQPTISQNQALRSLGSVGAVGPSLTWGGGEVQAVGELLESLLKSAAPYSPGTVYQLPSTVPSRYQFAEHAR